MASAILRFLALAIALSGYSVFAQQRIDIGGTFADGALRNFHLSIGEYYRVPEREVVVVRERRIPEPELPVVFFLSQHARVPPQAIVDLRLAGRSWTDITLHFGLTPEIYYVPVTVDAGPPYGHAYGHWKKHPKRKWKEIRLSDPDVVELVNVKFISDRYGYSPDVVVKARSSGREFISINDDYHSKKDIKRAEKEREKEEKREEKEWRKEHKHEGKKHGKHKHKHDDDD